MDIEAVQGVVEKLAYHQEKSKYFSDMLWTLSNYRVESREMYVVPTWTPKMDRPKFRIDYAVVYHPKDQTIDGVLPVVRQPVRVPHKGRGEYCWDRLMPILKESKCPYHFMGPYLNARPTTNMKIRCFLKKVPKITYRVELWSLIMDYFDDPCNNTYNMI